MAASFPRASPARGSPRPTVRGLPERRAATAFDDVRRLKMKAANARGRLDPFLTGGGIAVAAVLVLIGWRILDGRSTVGDFTGFVTALILAAQPIRRSATSTPSCRRRARPSALFATSTSRRHRRRPGARRCR